MSNSDACRDYIRRAGLSQAVQSAPGPSPSRILEIYDYRDEAGQLLFQVVRFEPKTFRQRRPDAASPDGWVWKLDGVRRVLYRLPETLAAVQRGETIFVVEGEKDAAALVARGLNATCNPGGAGKWLDEYTTTLRDADVVIIADEDETGRNHARLVAGRLHGNARTVRRLELPDFNGVPVKDTHDFFAAGATDADFRAALAAAQPYSAPAPVDLHAARPPQNVSNPVTVLPEDEDDADDKLAPFPLDALPSALAGIIAGVSRCERVPHALPAIVGLGVASAACGSGLEILSAEARVTRPNLYLLGGTLSGVGKSRVFSEVSQPVVDHQNRLLEVWREKTSPQLQSELRIIDKEVGSLERKAAKAPDPAERERLRGELEYRLARKEELTRRAAMPCIIVQDTTSERLAVLLRDNGEKLFSASAESRTVLDVVLGKYSGTKSEDVGIYLSAYSADYFRQDRLGRDAITLHHPVLAVCWLTQEDYLGRLFEKESLTASGFLPRFLVCNTRATPRKIIEGETAAVSEGVRAQWAQTIADLLATFHAAEKAFRIEPRPESKKLLDGFFNQVVDQRVGEYSDIPQFASRYAEQAWRTSVVLHAMLHGGDAHKHPLDHETAANAIRVVEWFSAQQRDIMAKGRQQAAKKIEDEVFEFLDERMARQGVDYVTAKDVYRKRVVVGADIAHSLLARLEKEGLLVGQDVMPPGGGKVTRIFRRKTQQNPVPE